MGYEVTKNLKQMKKFMLLSVLTLLISSCAFHKGYISDSSYLGSNNFTYVKTNVEGKASTIRLLGIGGFSKQTLVNDARKDLLTKNPLQDGQALVNITVSWKITFVLPLYMGENCTVSASIVQFK
jgi:hypothetical protein